MTISTEAKSGRPQLSIGWGEPYVDGDGKRSAWVRSTGLGEAYLSKLDAIELDRDLRRSLLSELFLGNMGSVAARSMAEHFLRSACNWGLALFAAEVPGMRQADPEAFGQLMQASTAEERGGASMFDVGTGRAQLWQRGDLTYKMSGSNGRVWWRPAVISPTHAAGSASKLVACSL